VVLIAVILILPVEGIAGHHRYNTCVDFDSLIDSAGNYQENNGNYMNLDLYEGYFYVCKIGYIEGEVTLGWDVKNSINANISIIVLNNNNLNNFISGNSYGHSNMDLADLYLDWNSRASINEANPIENREITTNLGGDNYYLVINYGYRTTFQVEEVNQKNVFDNLKYARYLSPGEDTSDDSAIVRATIDLDYPD
ncbi:MAG: hypothetical protein VYE32_03730, partial [Candidatus Thermoplasmatota archaeon]|nr:hypothetical protein [Candidatus Thermoplasmatota archaeon]